MNDELLRFVGSLEKYNLEKAKNIVKTINNKQMKLKAKEEQIEDLQYESNLIEIDIIDDIKNDLYRSDFNLFCMITPNGFDETWRYSRDNTKEDYKKSYNFVTNRIKEYILKNNKDYKLQSVINYNFGVYYEFEYKYKNKVIRIDVPMYPAANKDNYKELMHGYRVYLQTSSNCWKQIYCNIDYKEITNFLEDYTKKEV